MKIFKSSLLSFPIQSFILFFCSILFLFSCDQKSEYERRLETELSKNTRVDSIFLGYAFGMSRKEFFAHSWDLNRQKIITGEATINYNIEGLKSPASMNFYPQFKNDKIYKMPVEVSYNGWAPWNADLFSDSLLIEMINLYEQKYNTEFFRYTFPEFNREVYVDIQGNRQISMYRYDERKILIEFTDLTQAEN